MKRAALIVTGVLAARLVLRAVLYVPLLHLAPRLSHATQYLLCRSLYGTKCPHIIPGSWA